VAVIVEPSIKIINDNDILPVMESMLACLCDALASAPGGLPCACQLLPGDQVPFDYCDCTNPEYGCGQAWVRLDQSVAAASIYNSVYARKAINTSRCVGLMAHRLQIGVTRCAPGMTAEGNPPETWQYHDAVTQQLGDFAAMRRALDCCLPLDKRRDWLFERYQPVGPMGNCVGGYIVMNFRII